MANISVLSRLVSGVQRNVDLSANTLVVNVIKVGGGAGTDLTKTILDRLVSLQNGTDVDATYHTHDSRYYTKTEIGSATGITGSDLAGDDNTYSNFTPTTTTVKGALSGIDTALAAASSADFGDDVFRVHDDGDNTKKIALQASNIATMTTRTISMPDVDINLAEVNTSIQQDGLRPFSADQSMGSFHLTNVADPVSAQQAATKAYVDSLLDGRTWKQPVRVASTANINLAVVADPSPVDGVTLSNGNRILLKDQTSGAENGIYVAVTAIDPTTWIRSSDANTANELEGAAVFVEEGTISHDWQYAQTADSITLGTTPLVWVVTSANSFSGHDMISLVGGQISVDLATTSGLASTNPGNAAGQLKVKTEASNPTLQVNGSNELGVKLDGAGAVITGGSGVKSNVDGSTIEISSNALRVKDVGITAAKLNTNVADQTTVTGGGGSALAVQSAPKLFKSVIAGESMAANTSFLVRFALNGETAGRIYKADKDSSTTLKCFAVGIALSTGAVSPGGSTNATLEGTHILGASDTPFSGTDIGKPVYLTASGAWSTTIPSAANEAAYQIGVVENTDRIWVGPKQLHAIAIYDQNTTIGGGGLVAGTPLTLPGSGTYTGLELEVYLNGQRLEDVVDYNFVGSVPRTQVSFTFDLVQNDLIRFRVDRVP